MRQQTQLSVAPQVRFQRNALRAHLAEYGVVAPKGVHNVGRLLALADVAALPEAARLSIRLLADQFRNTHTRIEEFIAMVKAEAQGNPVVKRLQTVPGIGPITASASAGVGPITASVPNVSNVKAARDLAGSC